MEADHAAEGSSGKEDNGHDGDDQEGEGEAPEPAAAARPTSKAELQKLREQY